MNTDTPIIEIKNLTRRYGKLDAVNGLSLTVRAGQMLRLLRPQRRGQDHHHQVPAEPAPPQFRHGARVRPRPAEERSGREIAARLRAGHGRVLSVDDRARHAGISRLVPQTLERRHRNRPAETLSTRPEPEGQQSLERPEARSSRSSARFVRNRNCSCWTSRPPASTRLSAANSSRPSSAPINPAIRAAARCSSPRI